MSDMTEYYYYWMIGLIDQLFRYDFYSNVKNEEEPLPKWWKEEKCKCPESFL